MNELINKYTRRDFEGAHWWRIAWWQWWWPVQFILMQESKYKKTIW